MTKRAEPHEAQWDSEEKTVIIADMQQSNPHPDATPENLDPRSASKASSEDYEDHIVFESSSSSMTTKELQQHLKATNDRFQPVKILFEIPSSRTIEEPLSKYVVYQVAVIRSGSYDPQRVSVERRYSDFSRLHQQLLEDFSEELQEVTFPRKLLTGNFRPKRISERSIALRGYLAELYAVRCVRRCRIFLDFFTEPEQRRAYGLLRAGQFRAALALLQTVLEVQEKLEQWHSPGLLVPTLCALTVCYRDLNELEAAFITAQRALPAVRRYGLKRYRGPLLVMVVNVGYQLGRPVAQLQEELTQFRDTERGLMTVHSLKELVVQEFT